MRLHLWKLALVGIVAMPILALAGPAYEFTSVGQNSTNGSWVFGIDFTVGGSNLAVSALGYYDDFGDGFLNNHEVGIYNSTGTLLASTIVTNADPLTGHFRYDPISAITLLAGQTYRVVGVSHSDNYAYTNPGFSADLGITYLGDTYDSGTTLFDPVGQFQNDVTNGFFGPNFLIGSSTGVPEPATFGTVGIAIAGLFLGYRRLIKH